MKAISLWQPWASAMAVGTKKNETRGWVLPKWAIGPPVAIHAAKRWTREEKEYAEDFLADGYNIGFTDLKNPPLGGIVAVVRFSQCMRTDDIGHHVLGRQEYEFGNYFHGRFAWVTNMAIPIPFIPCKGQQGFWDLDLAVEGQIREYFDPLYGMELQP